jgi:hypothetical protein
MNASVLCVSTVYAKNSPLLAEGIISAYSDRIIDGVVPISSPTETVKKNSAVHFHPANTKVNATPHTTNHAPHSARHTLRGLNCAEYEPAGHVARIAITCTHKKRRTVVSSDRSNNSALVAKIVTKEAIVTVASVNRNAAIRKRGKLHELACFEVDLSTVDISTGQTLNKTTDITAKRKMIITKILVIASKSTGPENIRDG